MLIILISRIILLVYIVSIIKVINKKYKIKTFVTKFFIYEIELKNFF